MDAAKTKVEARARVRFEQDQGAHQEKLTKRAACVRQKPARSLAVSHQKHRWKGLMSTTKSTSPTKTRA